MMVLVASGSYFVAANLSHVTFLRKCSSLLEGEEGVSQCPIV